MEKEVKMQHEAVIGGGVSWNAKSELLKLVQVKPNLMVTGTVKSAMTTFLQNKMNRSVHE